MYPAQILEHLEKVKALISTFPADTDITSVNLDGIKGEYDSINVFTPLQGLVKAGLLEDRAWTTEDKPDRDYLREIVSMGGLFVTHFSEKERTAKGGANHASTGENPSAGADGRGNPEL